MAATGNPFPINRPEYGVSTPVLPMSYCAGSIENSAPARLVSGPRALLPLPCPETAGHGGISDVGRTHERA